MEKIKNILVACSLAAIPAMAGAEGVSGIHALAPETALSVAPYASSVYENITVSGKVTDESGKPLAGVNVAEKGTANFTVTDADGNFSLSAESNSTLIFSLAKYETTEVSVNGNASLGTIMLNSGMSDIDVAFRKAAKDEILGGVASVNVASLMDHNYFFNTEDNLYTYVSGYNGTAMWGIYADILILVDGVPRAANNVLPTEIENITFLKGAQAVNLYGSRGAKGAILVTTKRGKVQPMKISARANTGVFVDKCYPEYLGAAEYMHYYNIARANDGLDPLYSDEEIYNTASGKNPYRYPDVDFYSSDYISKYVNRNDVTAEISGGSEFARYYSNISYYGNNDCYKFGEAKHARTDRMAIRGNVDMDFNEYITAAVDASITMYNSKGAAGASYWDAAANWRPNRIAPFIPASYISSGAPDAQKLVAQTDNILDGQFLAGSAIDKTNVFADMYYAGKSKNTIRQFQFDFRLDFKLSKLLEGLSFHTLAALDYNTSYNTSFNNTYRVFTPVWSNVNGKDEIVALNAENIDKKSGAQNVNTNYNNRTTTFFAHLDYDKVFGKHTIGAMILANGFQRENSGQYHAVSNANLGFDLRYDFAKRYFVQFTASAPYSAKLPEGKRAGFSPSLSLGWNVSNEEFFNKDGVFSSLFVSVSASDLCEDIDIDGYYLYNGAYMGGGWFTWGDHGRAAIQCRRGDNPDLGYVHRKEISANIRLGMLSDKLTFDFSAYNNLFTDLIYSPASQYPSYFSYGYPETKFIPNINFNEDQRKGFDVSINYKDTFGDVKFQGGINLTSCKAIAHKRDDSQYENAYQYREGTELNTMWGYECLGYFQDEDDIKNSPSQSAFGSIKPGDLKYKDQNGDGIIDNKDQVDLGKKNGWQVGAPYAMGINLAASYKNFTLYVLGIGMAGYYNMDNSKYYYPVGDEKYSANARDTWNKKDNPNAKYPRLTTGDGSNNRQASDFWLRKISVFDLTRVQLTYDFPSSMFANNRVLSGMSVYVSGADLLTISKEREYLETSTGRPQTRFYNLGVKLTF